MEDNDDPDYIPEKSKNKTKPRRYAKSIGKNGVSFATKSNNHFTPNGAGINKKKKSISPSKKYSETIIYQCSLCPFQVRTRYKLKQHFKTCLQGSRRARSSLRNRVTEGAKFRCEYCLIETGTLKGLLWHKRSHANLVAAGLIGCSQCNLTFFTVDECTEHINDNCLGSPEKNEKNRNDYVDASTDEHIAIKVEECSDEEHPIAIGETELVKQNGFYSIPSRKKAPALVIYQCSLCTFQANLKHKLKVHFKPCSKGACRSVGKAENYNVTEDAIFRCEYCSFEAATLKKLLSHKQCHAELIASGLIECDHCNRTFFSVEQRKKHLDSKLLGMSEKEEENQGDYVDASANENVTVKMEQCSDEEEPPVIVKEEPSFINQDEDDFEVVKQNGLYVCPCRQFQTDNRSHYLRHLKLIHYVERVKYRGTSPINVGDDEKKPLVCLQCQRKADSQLQLVVHMALDHVKPGCLFTCLKPFCAFEAGHKDELRDHLMNTHKLEANVFDLSQVFCEGQQASFKCTKCFYKTNVEVYLKAHYLNSHSKKSDAPFQCPWTECRKHIKSKQSLQQHMKVLHGMDLTNDTGPLTNAYSEGRQAAFTCSKCFYETTNETHLKAHSLYSHSKDSDAPFRCPWSKCHSYQADKNSLERHLMVIHGMDVTDGTTAPLDRGWDPHGLLLSCRTCGHRSRTEFQMMIHRALYHHPRSQRRFGCPLPKCFFITYYKPHLRRHLREVHNLGKEYFHNYLGNLSEPEEAEDAVEQVDINLNSNRQTTEDASLSKGGFNCDLCTFTTYHRRPFRWHQVLVHHKRRCDICKKTKWGKYQWFWHNYSVHNRQKDNEIDQWSLKCNLCGYEGTTNSSYEHGATHELPRVMFQTLFCKVASGHVTFQYVGSSKIGLENDAYEEKSKRKEANENSVAPSAIKVLDETMPDEEVDVAETLQQLGTEKAITIEFAEDSEAEAETQSNNGDPNIYNPLQDNDLLIKKSEFLTCQECNFETQDAALLNLHGVLVHGNWTSVQTKQYRCPEDDCPFQTKHLTSLKCHLINIHRYNQSDKSPSSRSRIKRGPMQEKEEEYGVREPDEKHVSTKSESDPDWDPTTETDYHQDSKRKVQSSELTRNHVHCLLDPDKKQSQEPPKWRLKCTHCPYETSLKKAAHRHSARHCRLSMVTFHKYEGNQRRGILKYRYLNRNLQASTRSYNVGSRPVDLNQHNTRFHMPTVENIRRPRAREVRKHVTGFVRNKLVAESPGSDPSKHMKVKDSGSNKPDQNRVSVRKEKEDFVDADTYSDRDEEEAGLEYSKNRSDIETEEKHTTIDSDWISALENDILGDDNEVIRIEVTANADENLDPVVEAVTEAKTTTLCIKCKNEGCDYVCHNTDDIQKHAESCAKSRNRRGQLCETSLPGKETLQNHIRYEHLINQEAKPKPKTKLLFKRHKTSEEISGRVSFKCWMCDMSIVNTMSLRSHTHLHAHEENNFDLKVRYSKYKGDTRVGTIVIEADPAYVPKTNSNVPMYGARTVRSPALEYDPELPVFACAECNFKTNKEPELTRHKNLHWSKEKAAAFDAQNSFTCGVCFFKCLDAATLKEHVKKHKSRSDTKNGIEKLGKSSWNF